MICKPAVLVFTILTSDCRVHQVVSLFWAASVQCASVEPHALRSLLVEVYHHTWRMPGYEEKLSCRHSVLYTSSWDSMLTSQL